MTEQTVSLPAATPRTTVAGSANPWWTLVFTIIVCAPVHLVFFGDPSFDSWRYRPYLALVDLLLILLIALRVVPTVRGLIADRRAHVARALAVLWLVLAVSFAFHPGSLGAATLMRLAGIVVMTCMIGRADRQQLGLVVTMFVLTAAFEAGVCLLQKLTGHGLGLVFLGEVGTPFNPVGTHLAPTGTIFYPYPLAGMGLVAASIGIASAVRKVVGIRIACLGALAGGILVGLSFSVAGALSAGALIGSGVLALLIDRTVVKRTLAAGLLVFTLGLVGSAAIDVGGWQFKGERSTQGIEAAGNGRVGMLREAAAMARRWPVIGIGPGNFMAVRDSHPELKALATESQPVHMVPFLIVVEGGIPAALALCALATALLIGFRRSGWLGPMVVLSFSGFLLFDHYPWLFGIGTATLGVWFGVTAALARMGDGVRADAKLQA